MEMTIRIAIVLLDSVDSRRSSSQRLKKWRDKGLSTVIRTSTMNKVVC